MTEKETFFLDTAHLTITVKMRHLCLGKYNLLVDA